MTCPLCEDTGKITVISVDESTPNGIGRDILRPCPMGCKVPIEGTGVAGNMSLEAKELKPQDYSRNRGKNKIAWKNHYLGYDE